MRKSYGVMQALLLVGLAASPAVAQQEGASYQVEEGALKVLEGETSVKSVPLPCVAEGKPVVAGATLYAACADEGLVVVSLASPQDPEPTEIRAVGGKVRRVFLVGGKVWVEVEGQGARVLDGQAAAVAPTAEPPVSPEPEPEPEAKHEAEPKPVLAELTGGAVPSAEVEEAEPQAPAVGQVIAVEDGYAFIDIGRRDGVEQGMLISFEDALVTELPGDSFTESRPLASGRVVAVTDDKAKVGLPLNVDVPVGARAREGGYSGAYLHSSSSPDRAVDYLDVGFMLRPFLGVGTLGGGVVADAKLGYHFDFPFAIELFATPLTLATATEGDYGAYSLALLPSFDSKYIQIGLGVGLMSFGSSEVSANIIPGPNPEEPEGGGVTLVQGLRLGTLDGLHGAIRTTIAVRNERFEWAALLLSGQIPINVFGHSWLVGRINTGETGTYVAEGGVRFLVAGNGSRGSLYLEPTFGAVIIDADRWEPCRATEDALCRRNYDYGGPMVGFGMNWRL